MSWTRDIRRRPIYTALYYALNRCLLQRFLARRGHATAAMRGTMMIQAARDINDDPAPPPGFSALSAFCLRPATRLRTAH
ncbi:MAG: hypothetical protein ABIF28_10460 [Pseudomonadota bacterium]